MTDSGAWSVLRRGVQRSAELKEGWRYSILLALFVAAGRLVVPIAIQRSLDAGLLGPNGYQPGVVMRTVGVATVASFGITWLGRVVYLRLVRAAERALASLRIATFRHIHELSPGQLADERRGALVSRVTSDIETLAQFVQWGAISWVVNIAVVVTTLAVMAWYSWQLALVTLVVFAPVVPLLRIVQRRQISAYDRLRGAVAGSLSEISEAVMGAAVIRSTATQPRMRRRLRDVVDSQYRSQMRAAWFFAMMFPLSDIFGAIALGLNLGLGVWFAESWSISTGDLVAVMFLCGLLLQPIGEIGEILDQTQAAISGWRRVLNILDEPSDLVFPEVGTMWHRGAPAIEISGVTFEYLEGSPVLRDVELEIPAGVSVAIVGETGSGKTTLAKLLCRLADPTNGHIVVGGVDLREVSERELTSRVALVPQEGFLLNTTLRENLALALEDGAVTDDLIREAADALNLSTWVDALPAGLDTQVGERGEALSVGERQFVALIRAQLIDPDVLILDEATSSVDPESDRMITDALHQLADGRTMVSIAHRLATAMAAEMVIVMDQGEVVGVGSHQQLVASNERYRRLYDAWVSNTQASDTV